MKYTTEERIGWLVFASAVFIGVVLLGSLWVVSAGGLLY